MSRLKIMAVILSATALCCCGGSPGTKAGQEALANALSGVAGVQSFRKTEGRGFELMGTRGYHMSFEATAVVQLDQAGLEALGSAPESSALLSKLGLLSALCGGLPARGATATLRGVITFARTDSGWTVADIRRP